MAPTRRSSCWPGRGLAAADLGGRGRPGHGYLLAQQLVTAGERVLDVQPKLGARVRLLAADDVNKNDLNYARPVAVAALRSPGVAEVRPDDHATVLRVWSKRHRAGPSSSCSRNTVPADNLIRVAQAA